MVEDMPEKAEEDIPNYDAQDHLPNQSDQLANKERQPHSDFNQDYPAEHDNAAPRVDKNLGLYGRIDATFTDYCEQYRHENKKLTNQCFCRDCADGVQWAAMPEQ